MTREEAYKENVLTKLQNIQDYLGKISKSLEKIAAKDFIDIDTFQQIDLTLKRIEEKMPEKE